MNATIVHAQAIGEAMIYDLESGQVLTGSIMGDMIPRALQFQDFNVAPIQVPIDGNPWGGVPAESPTPCQPLRSSEMRFSMRSPLRR
ncbi:MAG: hypothetical protein CBD27_00265 [Rhodospirillaceae bacterium TMED167]|nr:hypothetical protein [Rhodospirillaceae bacterium]OUW31327.1 MAG: hypothetical protein CBD27_00265 [Rhodospirillaceae bacterium TMED167]